MSIASTCRVEFFGGPLDGYQRLMTISLDPFLGVKVCAEGSHDDSHGILAGFSRVFRPVRPTMIPLAVYELQFHDARQARYEYVRSFAVSTAKLQSGHGWSMEHVPEPSP